MVSSDDVRVAIVGLGKIAQLHHIPNIAALAGVKIVAVADLTYEHGAAIVLEYGLEGTATVAPHAIPWQEIDALFVLNRDHGPVVRTAMEEGVPCFIEKPVCWSSKEADDLAVMAGCTAAQRSVVGYMKRYAPGFDCLAQELSHLLSSSPIQVWNFAGGAHKERALRSTRRPLGVPRDTRSEETAVLAKVAQGRENYDFGTARTMLEFGIHELNLLRRIAGPVTQVLSVERGGPSSLELRLAHAHHDSILTLRPEFDSRAEWENGLSWTADGVERCVQFSNPFEGPVTDKFRASTVFDTAQGFSAEIEHFIEVVRGRTPSSTGLMEGLEDVIQIHQIMDLISE